MPELVTIGETCVVLEGTRAGPLRYIDRYERCTGGAETNVAVGLIRLGHSAGWISRLGQDEFGEYLLRFFRGEGLDVSQVRRDSGRPTGLFIRQLSGLGGGENFYYRAGSAAGSLSCSDLDERYISQARILHVTGITPALSPSCQEAVLEAVKMARRNGVRVSLDPNLRLKMWDAGVAREVLTGLMRHAHIVLPGIEECRVLFGTDDVSSVFEQLEALGVEVAAIKLGAQGAVARRRGESAQVSGWTVPVVDTFGAGDAFAAGFLAGELKGWSLQESLKLANAVAALSVSVRGNIEALPTLDQVQQFLQNTDTIQR